MSVTRQTLGLGLCALALCACTTALPEPTGFIDTNPWGAKPCDTAADCPTGGLGVCDVASCEAFVCQKATAADGAPCVDGDPCLAGAACQAGACQGAGPRLFDLAAGAAKSEVATAVVRDGQGFAMLGVSRSSGLESAELRLLDGAGRTRSTVTGLRKDNANLTDLVRTQDGGFAASGRLTSGGREARLVRMQADGTPLWDRTYSDWNFGRGALFALVRLPDQGIFAVGEGQAKIPKTNQWAAEKALVIRVDAQGNPSTHQIIPEFEAEGELTHGRLFAVDLMGATHAVSAGYTRSPAPGASLDGWILKHALDGGQAVWKRQVGDAGDDKLRGVVSLGGQAIAVGTRDEAGNQEAWAVAVDTKGEVLWQRTYGGKRSLVSITRADEGLVAVGDDFSKPNRDGLLLRIDKQGRVRWQRTFGGEGNDGLHRALLLPDGLLLVGETDSKGAGETDHWLVRTDTWGNLTCAEGCLRDRHQSADCDDHDACTADGCDPKTGACTHTALPKQDCAATGRGSE